MKKIKEYIDSGNLEQHCFDLFNSERAKEITELSASNPGIKQELAEIEQTIELLAKSQAIEPHPRLRGKLLNLLGFAGEQQLDINALPPTSKYSDHISWLNAVEHLLPAEPYEDFFMHVLQQNERIAQMLVVTRLAVEPELHEDIAESFFILKGCCTCTIGDKQVTLNAGNHLDIPLHVTHNVKIESPYVIAILQHQFS
jgi:mannose-6-phosphate isomerase-like protein (cupin superfamily)